MTTSDTPVTICQASPHTLPGLTTFITDPARKGKAYGLATNPAAITPDGRPSWKAMLDAGLNLAALFGPEHGFRGDAQDAVHIKDDTFRGIPTYSLYGTRYRPEPWMLQGLDALVYDMQDVGCRYYTYLYTLAYCMEACEQARLPLIVLDRPNPIGGTIVEGSPIPPEADSFVGGYGLSPRYGMTVGEVATYLARHYCPTVSLEVVPLTGWETRPRWDKTGLPWPLPSPNLPSLDCATLYPGTCLVEGTWLSEGRGTTRPFEITGAPWIDSLQLQDSLASLGLSGVTFSPIFFTPTISKFQGEQCQGILASITNPHSLKALDTGIAIVKTIHDLYPEHFRFRESWEDPEISFFDRLAGGPTLRTLIQSGSSLADCIGFAHKGQPDFLTRRESCLLYT